MIFPTYKTSAVADLIPYARNSRTHSDAQVAQIAASIRGFGFTKPVLIDEQNGIIAGHGRVMAARKLGMETVPVIEVAGLTKAQKRAYVIADNKIALNAGWDEDMLRAEFEELRADGFDLDLTGFDAGEIEKMFQDPVGPAIGTEGGVDYQEKYAILVECDDEEHQKSVFDRLQAQGYSVKVLVN